MASGVRLIVTGNGLIVTGTKWIVGVMVRHHSFVVAAATTSRSRRIVRVRVRERLSSRVGEQLDFSF